MTDETREPEVEQDALKDLDVDMDEADQVKGGRLGDPCDGGE